MEEKLIEKNEDTWFYPFDSRKECIANLLGGIFIWSNLLFWPIVGLHKIAEIICHNAGAVFEGDNARLTLFVIGMVWIVPLHGFLAYIIAKKH